MRRTLRIGGLAMMVAGTLCLAWAVTVWRWQDPFTAVYTWYEQGQLRSQLAQEFKAYRPIARQRGTSASARSVALEEMRAVRREAAAFRAQSRTGGAIGRIRVPRLGLNIVLVNGTQDGSLTKGPGRDQRSFMPGEGRLVYVAGHRTTYLAPFAHIDAMRPGDLIYVEMPYASFVYRATGHVIVPANDLAVLRPGRTERLALQACHPRFFATNRYIVWAVPTLVTPRGGVPYHPLALAAARPVTPHADRLRASARL